MQTLILAIFGQGVFFGLMYAVWKANARRWNRLARFYRADDELSEETIRCCPMRRMQTVILVGGHVGWNSYKGIVSVGVTNQGIVLRLLPPFSFLHPPLFIPFRESRIEPRKWYLIGRTSQLTVDQVSNVQIILDDELLQWIEGVCPDSVLPCVQTSH